MSNNSSLHFLPLRDSTVYLHCKSNLREQNHFALKGVNIKEINMYAVLIDTVCSFLLVLVDELFFL